MKIQTHLNFIQMGLNQGLVIEVSNNVRIFGGTSINGKKNIDKVFEGETRSRKSMGKMQVCYGDSEAMEYLLYSSLNIESLLYVLKRRHSSLDLNGPKVHTN